MHQIYARDYRVHDRTRSIISKHFGGVFFRPALLAAVLFTLMSIGGASQAQKAPVQSPDTSESTINAFQLAQLSDLRLHGLLLIRNGDLKKATQVIRRMIDLFPQIPGNHYFLAAVLAKQGDLDAAFDRLAIAIRRGFSNVELMLSDPALAPLRRQERFQSLVAMFRGATHKAEPLTVLSVSPAAVKDGIALVDESNTRWVPRLKILESAFRFGPNNTAPAVVQPGKNPPKQLNDWYSKGLAAGNTGDVYVNYDKGHSSLPANFSPQLAHVKYGAGARKIGIGNGLNAKMFFNTIAIGNSSTVSDGRSQARHALTLPGIPNILYLQYTNNQLYVYPEHKDYDPERGDLLPANTPYMIISQGSSGSDQPFVRAVASILAAFKPDVKKFLRQERLVMPTVQMIFRRGQKTVSIDRDYLSAWAHPPVFNAKNINLVKMINLANQLNIEDIPPVVSLKVVEESGIVPGIDDFTTGISETLFDTPGAIARVVRATAYEKRMVVRAEISGKEMGEKPEFQWVVLSGDFKRIKINRRNEEGSEVELIIPWHERRPASGQTEITTDRVEIGVFVKTDKYYSAPAIINFLYPPNQKRKYNDKHQIISIDHQDPEFTKRYAEPRLFSKRDWTDTYRYDENSMLTGWQRKRGKWLSNFTRDGAKITEWDGQDRAVKARSVRYTFEADKRGTMAVIEEPGEKVFSYQYDGKEDRTGLVREE